MTGARYGIALEGWPVVLALAALTAWLAGSWPLVALAPALLLIVAVLKFRDPSRTVPADPLGVVSPVDGKVCDIERRADGVRITIAAAPLGAYLLRSPTEGKVLESGSERGGHGIRIRTDEGHEVLLRLRGARWLPSAAANDYGERVGQGQRCGVLRMAKTAEVWLPRDAWLLVAAGARVVAGESVLARFGGGDQAAGGQGLRLP